MVFQEACEGSPPFVHTSASTSTGMPYLIRFPGGPLHMGYYTLLGESDLFEDTLLKDSAAGWGES